MKDNYIAFSINKTARQALFTTTEQTRIVVLPLEEVLQTKLGKAARKLGLNSFIVLRGLVNVYLSVRKSTTEDPIKGLRAMVRTWLMKVKAGKSITFNKSSAVV